LSAGAVSDPIGIELQTSGLAKICAHPRPLHYLAAGAGRFVGFRIAPQTQS